MDYSGKAIQCSMDQDGIIRLVFDLQGESINKFNELTVKEFSEVTKLIVAGKDKAKGLLMSSNKDQFIMGADITEFLGHFNKSKEEMMSWLLGVDSDFNAIEDLGIPTCVAINGFALGGGFEVCLTTDFRVASEKAKIGLPETKLGILPGWGGNIRMSRLVGVDNAIEWITSGKQFKAEAGLKIGVIDAVVKHDEVVDKALVLLKRAIAGELDWKSKRVAKTKPIAFSMAESMMAFEASKGFVAGVAGPHYPSPVAAIDVMQRGATLERDEALKIEAEVFVEMTKTKTAESLVRVFLGDQYLKKVGKTISKKSKDINIGAVLGAGIMGGGIAYQSASKGTPIIMKDIAPAALDLGLTEATTLLGKMLKRGRIDATKMAKTLNAIMPTLSYGDFGGADVVVEAVVENEKVKKAVLADVEKNVRPGTILASNTSTISITRLAEALEHPENFCGMHFFNPVHLMPLVEVIRGEKSSEESIATTVAYALKMGKTPIVVNDCPGFLVNRILFPYFGGFTRLVNDGVDFARIDKVMEKFGWPMGPAYLLDVVGIDTAHHAKAVMAEGFPDRMKDDGETAIDMMYKNEWFGQKNKKGFYEYAPDRRGKLKKSLNSEIYNDLKPLCSKPIEISDEEIVERMMLPLIFESSRCLEDNIVNTATEVDMGLLFGLGFPPFRAGALKYADDLGAKNLVDVAKKYESLGNLYKPTEQIIAMAKDNKTFY